MLFYDGDFLDSLFELGVVDSGVEELFVVDELLVVLLGVGLSLVELGVDLLVVM